MTKSIANIKQQFPLLNEQPDLVYLDSANTSLTPQPVIQAMTDYYHRSNANVGRGDYQTAAWATTKVQQVRQSVADFIGAKTDEVIFTYSSTYAINQIAFGVAPELREGDVILLTLHEHSSNIIPWLEVSRQTGVEIYYADELDDDELAKIMPRARILVYSLVSNISGQVYDYAELAGQVHDNGGVVIVDTTQAASHLDFTVKPWPKRLRPGQLDPECDFIVLSAHKMYGPSGLGVLYIRGDVQDQVRPLVYGSQTFSQIDQLDYRLKSGPARFEPGTPNITGIIGLGAAIQFINDYGRDQLGKHDQQLLDYYQRQLAKTGLDQYVFRDNSPYANGQVGIQALAHPTVHPHDIAMLLDKQHIAVRADKACADVLLDHAQQSRGVIRLSFGAYTTTEDIDRFLAAYQQAIRELA